MSTEIWILLVLVAAAAAALITFFLARRGAPTRKQLNDLEAELETARNSAKQVEGRVSEHFERSAVLFGHLAKDYKAFLDHYSESAQALGLSEGRARELLEQGYQPLLTHLEQDVVNQAEAPAASVPKAAAGKVAGRKASADGVSANKASPDKASTDKASSDTAATDKASDDMAPAAEAAADQVPESKPAGESAARTEPPLIRDVVEAPRQAAKAGSPVAPAVQGVEDAARSARVVAVDLSSKAAADPKADRQAGQG